ncbi:MAG: DNA repair protein RecO [Vicingaceae bacterium]
MIKTSQAIVLGVIKYSDSASIVKTISQNEGLSSYIVKGLQSKKNKKQPYFQPLSIVNIKYIQNLKGGLHHLNTIHWEYVYESIPFHLYKSSVVMFLAEFFNKCFNDDVEEPVFNWLKQSLIDFDTTEYHPGFHIELMAQTAQILGFMPHLNFSETTPYFHLMEGCFVPTNNPENIVLNKASSKAVYLLFKGTIFDKQKTNFNYKERKELLIALTKYFQLHLSSFDPPKSLAVLETVLSEK